MLVRWKRRIWGRGGGGYWTGPLADRPGAAHGLHPVVGRLLDRRRRVAAEAEVHVPVAAVMKVMRAV
jgi:hypothetical protein